MKKILFSAFISLAALSSFAFSDAIYSYTNPTYIPSAVSPVVNYTAPTDYVITLQDRGVTAFHVTGTCTSLAAVAQVTVDGTNWVTSNVYGIATGSISSAASVSATGIYRVNTAGALKARLHVTALTATCNISAVATTAGVVDK